MAACRQKRVRVQLERILENPLFKRSTRLSAFLRYVVGQTLAGRGDSIKEQILALELYGRGSDFDAGLDPIVRYEWFARTHPLGSGRSP